MTDSEAPENPEVNAQSESAEPESAEPESDDATSSINLEDAEERASADYQQRIEEFDKVDSTPVVSVPATGESGTVEMPKS